jgi:phage shock protein PspC (stress-responsive transcriptional regulator)
MTELECRHCYQAVDFRAEKCHHCGGWEPIHDARGNYFNTLSDDEKEIVKYVVRVGRSPNAKRPFDEVVRLSAEQVGKNPGTWPHRQTDEKGLYRRWNGDITFELSEAFDYVCSVLQHGGDGYIFGSFDPMPRPFVWGKKARITVPAPPAGSVKDAAVSQDGPADDLRLARQLQQTLASEDGGDKDKQLRTIIEAMVNEQGEGGAAPKVTQNKAPPTSTLQSENVSSVEKSGDGFAAGQTGANLEKMSREEQLAWAENIKDDIDTMSKADRAALTKDLEQKLAVIAAEDNQPGQVAEVEPTMDAAAVQESNAVPKTNEWYRSRTQKVINGVCGGIAQKTGFPVIFIRLGFVFISAVGILIYVALSSAWPEEPESR